MTLRRTFENDCLDSQPELIASSPIAALFDGAVVVVSYLIYPEYNHGSDRVAPPTTERNNPV